MLRSILSIMHQCCLVITSYIPLPNVVYATRVLKSGVSRDGAIDIQIAQSFPNKVIVPWSITYKYWWCLTVVIAIVNAFFETYKIAFMFSDGHGSFSSVSVWGGINATVRFTYDVLLSLAIIISFNLAYVNKQSELVYDRRKIAWNYVIRTKLFWMDFIAIFPFFRLALSVADQMNHRTNLMRYLGLFRLFRLVPLYRVNQLYDVCQCGTSIPLLTVVGLTLLVFMLWSHIAACAMIFWGYTLGDLEALGRSEWHRYVWALNTAVYTFCTSR
jgi:hypothetical protein